MFWDRVWYQGLFAVGVRVFVSHRALLNFIFNITIHVGPVDTNSGMSLGLFNAHVSLMNTSQYASPHDFGNDYVVVQENGFFSTV